MRAVILVQLKPLLQHLGIHAARTLEAAASLCISRGHHEVSPEHYLRRMLDEPRADVALAARHFELDVGALARSLDKAIDEIPRAAGGKPVFAVLLVEWLQDAWMLASVDYGHARLRTGVLLRALAARPRRYLAADHEELDKVRSDELLVRFAEITASSSEEADAVATGSAPAGLRGGATAAGAAGTAPPEAARSDSALGRFAQDLTGAARAGKIDPVLGRDREIRQVIDILARRRKNNPIVVGEAGVGKTAVVEGLALRIAEGDVPELLRGVDVFTLDIGLLSAGAGVKGEFESRLRSVIDEVRGRLRGTILFIDEAHTLIGAGGPSGSTDAANLLKPALARGELRTIAATTWAEYKKYFEEDAALARRFQPVKVDEPSLEDAGLMLRGLKDRYERAHGVAVRDDAIDAAVKLSARYIAGRLLPDKAVDLLDTAAARVRVAQTSRPGPLEDAERAIAGLERRLAALGRDRSGGLAVDATLVPALEGDLAARRSERDDLATRWTAQRQAVEAVRLAREAARAAAATPPGPGAATTQEAEGALARALADLARAQGTDPLVRLEVDPEVVAEVVADWTGIPVGRMVRDDATQVLDFEARLGARIKGQDHALETVGRALRGARAGLADPNKPRVFLLVGPSGVGKTELGLAVADALFGGERFVVTINMSEYQDREMGVSGLLGSKPGYVGYGKGGTLTEAVRQRPYSVVLLDEIEKACQEVRNLFYQLFDKGTLTDGTGRTIDFKNTVVFLTTNLGADIITGLCAGEAAPDPAEVVAALRPTLNHALGPAWLARTTVVPFSPLGPHALEDIARLKLGRIAARMHEAHRVAVRFAPTVAKHIVARCVDAETGARNIDFILESSLLPQLSTRVLERLADGALSEDLEVDLDAAGELTVRFARPKEPKAPTRPKPRRAPRTPRGPGPR
ncbi:MAG: type VI secretion system ATPase TssH [Myxococcales bacterium]|nr:type VI secretion system ATPase TssH [Myxococcales bacterium]